MKRRARRLTLAGAALLILLSLLWWGRGLLPKRSVVEVAPELLFPPNISVAMRVTDFESAFGRHWASRGNDDSEDALEQLLRSLGVWDGWVERYGQRSARSRIKAYKTAVFELLGSEGWFVFGEWAAPGLEGTGEVSLLLFLRADSPITSRIGPLANLLYPGHKVRRTEYKSIDIYEYVDSENKHAISLANIGGWVCASIRSPGRSSIIRMIDQYGEALRTEREASPLFAAPADGSRRSALSALFFPKRLWGQLREFSMKRGRPVSKAGEGNIATWAQRFEKIDEVRLEQSGDLLLNLDLTLRGPRISNLESVLVDAGAAKTEKWDGLTTTTLPLSPCILQADFSYPFAVEGVSLFGLKWDELLKSMKGLRWINPKLVKSLKKLVEVDNPPPDARMGLAFYAMPESPIPAVALWNDKSPVEFGGQSPADSWRRSHERAAEARGDFLFASALHLGETTTTSTLAVAQAKLTDRVWAETGAPPLGYLSVNFDQLRGWMDGFPMILLSKNDRPRWGKFRSFAAALELAAGTAVLRLDRHDDELKIKIRTLDLKHE